MKTTTIELTRDNGEGLELTLKPLDLSTAKTVQKWILKDDKIKAVAAWLYSCAEDKDAAEEVLGDSSLWLAVIQVMPQVIRTATAEVLPSDGFIGDVIKVTEGEVETVYKFKKPSVEKLVKILHSLESGDAGLAFSEWQTCQEGSEPISGGAYFVLIDTMAGLLQKPAARIKK